MTDDHSIKQRLIAAGKTLFADKGFAGASVRDICKQAGASATMIHHYFGSKQGLFDAIVDEFGSTTFDVPLRLIAKPAQNREEFRLRLEMFITETFQALKSQAPVFRILARENQPFLAMTRFHTGLGAYLAEAQKAGLVAPELRTDLVTGIVLDRLGGQILYAAMAADDTPNVLSDADYADAWLAANTHVLIHGLAG